MLLKWLPRLHCVEVIMYDEGMELLAPDEDLPRVAEKSWGVEEGKGGRAERAKLYGIK